MGWSKMQLNGAEQTENKPSEANEAQTDTPNFSKVVLFALWTAVIGLGWLELFSTVK